MKYIHFALLFLLLCSALPPFLPTEEESKEPLKREAYSIETGKNISCQEDNCFKILENSSVSFNYTIIIDCNQFVFSNKLKISFFIIYPNGNYKLIAAEPATLHAGINKANFENIFAQQNPLIGNYILGYIVQFQEKIESSCKISGKIKANLIKPNGSEIISVEQSSVMGPIDFEKISLSSNLLIFP